MTNVMLYEYNLVNLNQYYDSANVRYRSRCKEERIRAFPKKSMAEYKYSFI